MIYRSFKPHYERTTSEQYNFITLLYNFLALNCAINKITFSFVFCVPQKKESYRFDDRTCIFLGEITVYRKHVLILGLLIQVTLDTTKLKLMKDPQFAIYGRTIRQNSPWEPAHCQSLALIDPLSAGFQVNVISSAQGRCSTSLMPY